MTSSASPPIAPDTPPSRGARWFASWKLWLALLFVGLALIALAVCLTTYRRMLAIRYLDDRGSIGFADDDKWRAEWFGEFGTALRSVEGVICNGELNDTALRQVAILDEMTLLSCNAWTDHQPLTEAGVTALRRLRHLEILIVYGELKTIGDQDPFVGLFAAKPPLVRVGVEDMQMSPAALAELTQIESIEELQLFVRRLESFGNLAPLPNLADLQLRYYGPFDASWLSRCPRLRTLHLYGPLSDDDLRQIADLRGLESLSLNGHETYMDVSDAGIAHLARLTSLTTIALPAELITPATLDVFRTMPALKVICPHGGLEDPELVEAISEHWELSERAKFPYRAP